jgi:hypothetical protein
MRGRSSEAARAGIVLFFTGDQLRAAGLRMTFFRFTGFQA